MTEDEKMQVAVFRFSVISDFIHSPSMSRREKSRMMRDKCSRKWRIPFSEKTRISKGTIRRWIRLYKKSNGDLKSLCPHDRSDQGGCRAMDEETSLSIALIHAKPYQPQGKGKIERWFKTVRSRFLPHHKAATLAELNTAFECWLTKDYQQKVHSATGQTPFERFTSKMHCLRTAPANLKDYFRKVVRRTVGKDRTITIDGRLYEGPVALIGKRVELLYHQSNPEHVEARYKNESFGMIRPVNLHVNYRVKRDKNNNPQMDVNFQKTSYQGGKLWGGKNE